MSEKFKKWLHSAYHQLVEINDTAHRKAAGLGLGVFLGIFPGMGPIAALVCSYLFRVNRASALLGSLLTNTWLSFVTLALSCQVGGWLTGKSHQDVRNSWYFFLQDFAWNKLLSTSFLQVIYPVLAGFTAVALVIAVVVYALALTVLLAYERKKKTRGSNLIIY